MGLIAGVVAGVATAATATTTAGVIAGVAAAGASAYGYAQQQKNKKQLAGAAANGAYGFRPIYEPVEYNPLYEDDPGYAQLAGDTIRGNLGNLPTILELVRQTNKGVAEQYRNRAEGMYPGLQGDFAQQQRNTSMQLRGELPFEDVRGIIGDTTERQSLLGNFNSSPQVAADLGLTRLQVMQGGQQALGANVGLMEALYPVQAVELPQKSFLYPSQTVPWAIGENQFNYTADAAERTLEMQVNASADPAAAAQANMAALQMGMQQGGGGYGGQAQQLGASAGQIASAFGGGAYGQNAYQPYNPQGGYTWWQQQFGGQAPYASMGYGNYGAPKAVPYTSPYY